jgi:hypothetical protein
MRSDLPEIKQGLQDRIEELCRQLLPHGRKEGGQWVCSNPHVDGDARKIPAMKIGLSRDRGAWRDWRNGPQGDVIALIAYCVTGSHRDTAAAMRWARDFLGIRNLSREEREQMRKAAAERQRRDAERSQKARAFKLIKAAELFEKMAEPLEVKSAARAHALAYFRGRNCPIDEIENLNTLSFRFSRATEWWNGAKWKNENGRRWKDAEGPKFPAVHSGMRQDTGIVTACHVTFLDPSLAKKAPVEPPKLMFGEAMGAVIEIATGGGAPFWLEAERQDDVIICEGIETGLSIAAAVPEARVWAGGSLAGMGGAPVHLPCVRRITVARDNNTGNAQAQRQLDRSLERLSQAGKPLVIMASHVGDDFNDLATGED